MTGTTSVLNRAHTGPDTEVSDRKRSVTPQEKSKIAEFFESVGENIKNSEAGAASRSLSLRLRSEANRNLGSQLAA